jgi:hypothetical protein
MRKHTKIYFDYFGYTGQEFIACEVCGKRGVDIAHIIARSKFGSKTKDKQDDIDNLMSLCRECHYNYDFNNKWTSEEMQEIHHNFIDNYGKFY